MRLALVVITLTACAGRPVCPAPGLGVAVLPERLAVYADPALTRPLYVGSMYALGNAPFEAYLMKPDYGLVHAVVLEELPGALHLEHDVYVARQAWQPWAAYLTHGTFDDDGRAVCVDRVEGGRALVHDACVEADDPCACPGEPRWVPWHQCERVLLRPTPLS